MAADREPDLLEQLTTDHEVLRVHFSEVAGLPLDDPWRTELAGVIADTLVRHLTAEEEHLYRAGPPADRTAVAECLQNHDALRALVREMRSEPPGSAGFNRALARLMEEATGHFGREEAQLFPAARGHFTPLRLATLGAQVRATERLASPVPPPTARAALPPDHLVPPELTWRERMRRRFRFGDTSEN